MRTLVVMLMLLAVMSMCSAQVISMEKFLNMGYSSFVVAGENIEECTQFAFKSDLNITGLEKNTQYTILSLHASFHPDLPSNAKISVSLNDDGTAVAELKQGDFIEGWARVRLPRGEIVENNVLKVCGKTAGDVNIVTVFADSMVGKYKEADFFGEDGFVVSVEPLTIMVGQEFKVYVNLRNYGSRTVDVELRYRKEELDSAMPYLEFLKGPTNYEARLEECKARDGEGKCIEPFELEFEYTAKSNRATEMVLLPAVVSYENVFGEIVEYESNRKKIFVLEPEVRLKGFIILDKEIAAVGELVNAQLALKNEGAEKIYNVRYKIEGNLLIGGDYEGVVEFIDAGETKYFGFDVSSGLEGEEVVGCSLQYFDYEEMSTNCDEVKITFEASEFDMWFIGGLVLLVIAVFMYLFIRYR